MGRNRLMLLREDKDLGWSNELPSLAVPAVGVDCVGAEVWYKGELPRGVEQDLVGVRHVLPDIHPSTAAICAAMVFEFDSVTERARASHDRQHADGSTSIIGAEHKFLCHCQMARARALTGHRIDRR